MIAKNKIISLTIIGLVIGFILGMLGVSADGSVLMITVFGGVAGFIAGWIWQTRAGEAEK